MLSLIDVDGMVGEELVTEAAQNGGRLGLVPFVWDLAYRRGARTFHYGLDSGSCSPRHIRGQNAGEGLKEFCPIYSDKTRF